MTRLDALLAERPDAVQACPEVAEILARVADLSDAMGAFGRALAACQKLAAAERVTGEVRLICARPRLARGDLDGARDLLKARIAEEETVAGRVRSIRAAASLLESRARPGMAADFLAEAAALAPGDTDIALRQLKDLLEAGRDADATRTAESAERRLAGNREALRTVVLLLARYGRAAPAVQAARVLLRREGITVEDTDAAVVAAAAANDPDLARTAAQALRDAARPDDRAGAVMAAVDTLRRHALSGVAAGFLAAALDQGEVTDPEARRLLGALRGATGDREGAVLAFNAYLDARGRVPAAAVAVAREWDTLGDPSRAVAVLRSATVAAGGSLPVELWLALGRALHETGDEAAEHQAYRDAAARSSDPSGTWLEVAEHLLGRGDARGATDAFREAAAVATDPDRKARALAGLAEAQIAGTGDRAAVEKTLLAALGTGTQDPEVVARVERVAARVSGNRSLRIAVLESAVRREPGRSDLWQRLAVARLEAGKLDDAAAAWERTIETATDRPAALAEAVTRLIKSHGLGIGLDLAGRPGNRGAVNPPLAQAVGEACLSIGDVPCASRYLKIFLSGPMVLDFDHEALARSLATEGLTDLALVALDRASRVAAPDRRWEVELQAGRVLLQAGRAPEAEARFQKALENSGKKRGVALRVAREMQALGHLSRAVPWYARAVADPDEAVRLQAVPAYVDCLWRLGRDDVLRGLLVTLARADWRRAGPLQAAALAIGATGRFAEAAALVVEGRASVREDERPLLSDLEIALWLRAGRIENASRRAREVCRVDAGEEGDTRCLAAANRLEGADQPLVARDIVAERVASGSGAKALRADLVVRMLRAGDRAGAIEQARTITMATPPDGMLLSRLGETFREQGLGATWADLLRHAPRGDGASQDAIVAAETARALLAAGDIAGATQAVETYLAARRGGEGRVYLEWVRAGYRDRGEALLARAREESIAEVDVRELTEVAEDLARAGHDGLLDTLLDRYRKGNEGIASADENIGRVLATLGRFDRAVEALSRVPTRSMTDEGRAALMVALWRLDRRTEALSVALSGFDGPARKRSAGSEDKPWSRAVLAFFLAEGAPAEAVAVLDRALDGPEASSDLRLMRARLRLQIGGEEALGKARGELLDVLPGLDGPSDEAFRFVRDEVHAGRGSGLADDLGIVRGVRAAEARYLAACLAGRRDRMDDARKSLAGEDPQGPRALLAVSRAAFECGRWEEAEPLAMRALKMLAREADATDAVRIALVSGRMLARHPEKAVEEALVARTEDPAAVQAALAASRFEAGDDGGRARALFERSRWFLLDPSAAIEAVEAALHAGDGALRKEAEARALASTDDRPQTRRRLADLYSQALRDDLAAEVLEPMVRSLPGDDSMAGRRVVSLLRAGDGAGAAKAADEYVARHGDRREAAAAVVSTAATDLTPELVEAWIPTVIAGAADPDASEALWQAARMAARMGRMDHAESWARASATLAPDGVGLRLRAAQSVLTDPALPFGFLDTLVAALGKRAGAEAPQVEKAAACGEASTAEAARECAGALAPATASTGLLPAGDRALAAGRYDAARALYEAADKALGGSAVLRRAIGARIVSYLGESSEAPLAARRLLGSMALGWIEADRVPRDSDGGALRGHLSEMAHGLPTGIETYEREIALAPSDGSLRNNLAYLLSLAGGDLERAQREARSAVILAPRGLPYYVETEAWARFLHDGAASSIPIQERARRAWSLDQGGGVAEGFYHLGRMLEAAGRPAAAREAYRHAAVLEPGDWSGLRALRLWRKLWHQPPR